MVYKPKIYLNFFTFLIVISIFYIFKCLPLEHNDNDFPLKYRLNNGNYIVIVSVGIYLYNPDFTSKIEIKAFGERVFNQHEDSYPTNIAQFSSEKGGYIICLVKNTIYILSKNGQFLKDLYVDYVKFYDLIPYSLIPYDCSENEYYFAIITKESNIIKCKKYKYNSIDNEITSVNEHSYNTVEGDKKNISCELMYYL